MSLVQAINAEVTPLNGAGDFSSKQGQFNIVFEISGGANQMLDLNSMRLLTDLKFFNSDNRSVNNFNYLSSQISGDLVHGGVAVNPVALAGNSTFTNGDQPFIGIDPRTGLSNCIQTIQFQDAESNVLEAVYSYPHLMNKISPMSLSQDDQLTWTSHIYGLANGGKSLQNQYDMNSNYQMSLKLYTGLTQSKPMPFVAVRGKLKIIITLNTPASALFGGKNNCGAGGTVGPQATNAGTNSYFKMNKVKLVYRTLVLDENAPVASSYNYKHFSSLQSTIKASNNQNIYNPNTTNAISVLTSFIRSNKLNSFSNNSIGSTKLNGTGNASVDIKQTNFLKNNVRFPLQFPIDERVYNENNDGSKNYDVQRSYYFMSTLTPLARLNNTLICPSTESNGSKQCGEYLEAIEPDTDPIYGVGIRYANTSLRDGTNFTKGQSFLQRINSGLTGDVANEMFSNVLSTRSIMITASGPIVMN